MIHLSNEEIQNRIFVERNNLDWLWLTIVFLFSINFLAKPNYLLLALFIIGLLIIYYKVSKFKITIDFILIFLFSTSYFLIFNIYNEISIGTILIYFIGPITCFFIGYFIVKDSKFIEKTLLTMAIGFFLHGFLNMIIFFQLNGFNPTLLGFRYIPNVWTGRKLAATLQGTYFTLVSSLLFYSFVSIKNKKLISFFLLFSIMFSVISSFIMGNRTLIAIVVLIFVTSFIIYSLIVIKDYKEIVKQSFYIVTVFGLFYLIYIFNIFGLKEFILNSTLYMRTDSMILSEDPRIFVYSRIFNQIFDFPFGGYNLDMGLRYAHNLWIDVLNATGIIPFFLLIIYTLKSIKNVIYIIKKKYIDIGFKILVFSIYTGFFLNFMVEPILEGVPYMFLTFCLFNGMIRKQVDIC